MMDIKYPYLLAAIILHYQALSFYLILFKYGQIQDHTYHMPNEVTEAWTVMAEPNSKEWPLGQFDIVIANMDSDQQWPQSGLTGKSCLLCYTFEN